jgi:hypothetical protein
MTDRTDETAARRDAEGADDSESEGQGEKGAPAKASVTYEHPVEPPEAIRQPPEANDVRGEGAMTEPMYSTETADLGEPPGDFEDDQGADDRQPRPGNAPAPGQRPSESGSTPSDIPTEADEDAHRDHAPGLRRRKDVRSQS